jgi:hypothetical protein
VVESFPLHGRLYRETIVRLHARSALADMQLAYGLRAIRAYRLADHLLLGGHPGFRIALCAIGETDELLDTALFI